MSTIIQYKYDKNSNQSFSLEEQEIQRLIPTNVTALDMVGLTWIFQDDE